MIKRDIPQERHKLSFSHTNKHTTHRLPMRTHAGSRKKSRDCKHNWRCSNAAASRSTCGHRSILRCSACCSVCCSMCCSVCCCVCCCVCCSVCCCVCSSVCCCVCCCAMQCVAVCCSERGLMRGLHACRKRPWQLNVRCSVWCSVLQHAAVCCSELQGLMHASHACRKKPQQLKKKLCVRRRRRRVSLRGVWSG